MDHTSQPTHFTSTYTNAETTEEYYPTYANKEVERKEALVETMNLVSMVIYSLVFVLGVTGNGLVIFITSFRMKKTVNTIWFLSLAVADFTFIVFLPLRIATLALGAHWHLERPMCKLHSTLALFNLYASVYHLVAISIDRCIIVRHPIWARNHRTPRLASLVVAGVWILALLLCSPNPFFREVKQQLPDKMVCYLHFHVEPKKSKTIHRAMVIFQFISAFVIPFGVITFCYGALVLRLRRSRLPLWSKPFKVITAVIVAFLVLCFPFHVFSFLETSTEKDNDFIRMLWIGIPLTYSLVYFNSCLNPFLYFFMGHNSAEWLKRSLFSALENALAEEGSLNTTPKKPSLSTELESREL